MQSSRGVNPVEIITLRFSAGEDLIETSVRAVRDLELGAGTVLSGSGTLDAVCLEVPTGAGDSVAEVERGGVTLLVSAQGHITEGRLNLYVIVTSWGEVLAGKVLPGTRVQRGVELALLRAEVPAGASAHRSTGPPASRIEPKASPPPGFARTIFFRGRPIDPVLLSLIPREMLRRFACLPIARSGEALVVAMADPNNPFALDELRDATGMRIQALGVDSRDLLPALREVLQALGDPAAVYVMSG